MNLHTSQESGNVIVDHRFPARARELSLTRTVTRTALNNQGWSTDIVEAIVLAIDEACQNIIRHAYRGECDAPIMLHIELQGERLMVILMDQAPAVSSDCMQPRAFEDLRPGGLGCHFIQQVMDHVSMEPSPSGQGNILRMTKDIKNHP